MGVLEYVCALGSVEVIALLIDRTVVHAIEAGEAIDRLYVPVGQAYSVDSLVVDCLCAYAEWEGGREGVVDCEGSLPYLRHLELRIHCRDGGWKGSVLRLDGGRVTELDELVVEFLAVEDLAGELAHINLVALRTENGLILNHTGVGRHIGEEHERKTSGEETGTATELEALVTEHIPYETYARGYGDVGVRPLAGVDVTAAVNVLVRFLGTVCHAVVESKDGVVGHKVFVVEEETVETHTVGKFEILIGLPLVLSVETELVELYAGCRVFLAVVAVGKADNLRSSFVEEVVEAEVTVVTGTVSHIGVVGHLVLVVDTGSHLVLSAVPGDVILDTDVGVVYGIVPGKELVTC